MREGLTAGTVIGLDHLTLEYHHTTNNGCFRHFGDAFRPVWVECLEVLSAAFDDQLLERGFIGVFQFHDDMFPALSHDLWIHEDKVPVVETGFHAGPFDAQDERSLTAGDGAGQDILCDSLLGGLSPVGAGSSTWVKTLGTATVPPKKSTNTNRKRRYLV